ncbi:MULTISPECIES: DHH family phosphoesterase [unclassified Salinivibrio]|uniref:DHH family phosphoesterase n=1 Tax=unclassified Salinivibrio TaxID=2636825 RepID=UPI00128AE360|nr:MULTISPECIES: DHH family phosphoesterase [unclassified Salinivibrio]MPS33446.1 DHH family phosphoesterase [Salinivibrio sp. VYel7]MPX94830.1 DHH family phosphoesterase [Salinivibrio sp. VYel9]MPX97599.1 DHH family phosphoesterase [Salinivibrio sp. VYel6]MPY01117.1 DHH family phosphoesterase [Salinivibrio sp. VYel4]MPY04129.1 DHH family phosphoesterase [Salinivibrio sp. VYel5]
MGFDVFNGDADGLTALVQWRLAHPQVTTLITGVKRDIALLKQVPTGPEQVTVLDISMAKNQGALARLLAAGTHVFYADHHQSGPIPDSPLLDAHIHTSANTCTALIIDKLLGGQYREWALVGAYGDNLDRTANALARQSGIDEQTRARLAQLGHYLNYNSYGASLDDLIMPPAVLYRHLCGFSTPDAFMRAYPDIVMALADAYQSDRAHAQTLTPALGNEKAQVYQLPDAAWARRISGMFGNQLANRHPDRAHAVLTPMPGGEWMVSIRAPLNRPTGAAQLAEQFTTGGGRAAAAGINALPPASLSTFTDAFMAYFSTHAD